MGGGPTTWKWSYATRVLGTRRSGVAPVTTPLAAGDLVACRVGELGWPDHLEDADGRRWPLTPGDRFVGAYAHHRDADETAPGSCLLGPGGLVGTAGCDGATEVEVVGRLVDDEGRALTCEHFARPVEPGPLPAYGTVAVVGVGASAGRAATVTAAVRGWAGERRAVGVARVTGAGSGGSRWDYLRAGALDATDFLDFGVASSFGCSPARLRRTTLALRDDLVRRGCDAVVMDFTGDLAEPQTMALLEQVAEDGAAAVVLAAADAASAHAGAALLAGLPLVAVSGAVAEQAPASRDLPDVALVPPAALADGAVARLVPRP